MGRQKIDQGSGGHLKVAIIGQQLNRNHADKLKGGIQTCERLHVKLLKALGHEVHFIAASDTESFDPDCCFHLLTKPSEESAGELARADKAKLSKLKTAEIMAKLNTINPSFVINHSYSSSHVRLTANLAKAGTPAIFFNHQNPVVASDISLIAKLESYIQLTQAGGALVCVSPYSRDLWREAIRKRLKSPSFSFVGEEVIDQVYDLVCPPGYVEMNDVKEGSSYLVVISRPTKEKNVDGFLKIYEKTGLKNGIVIFLAVGGELEDNEYWRATLGPIVKRLQHAGVPILVRPNAPRADVLSTLQAAGINVIPWVDESASIVALEGASYGVHPVILAKAGPNGLDHAATSLLGKNFVTMIPAARGEIDRAARDLTEVIKNVSDTNSRQSYHREILRNHAVNLHSFQQRCDDLQRIIELVTARVNKRSSNPLLEM